MTVEEWRPVAGFPDYKVSDLGRVVSMKKRQPRLLRGGVGPRGYRKVVLCVGGAKVTKPVHHLVAEAFIGPRPSGAEIRHLNDVKLENLATNLAYGSRTDNALDAVRNGRNANASKSHCPQGHGYTASNTYVCRGRRFCRTCSRERRLVKSLRAAGIAS